MGGHVMVPPDFPEGFEYLADLFFSLRSFAGSIENPITPGLVNDLGEYVSSIDRDIIWDMDRSFRKGLQEASEYWSNKK